MSLRLQGTDALFSTPTANIQLNETSEPDLEAQPEEDHNNNNPYILSKLQKLVSQFEDYSSRFRILNVPIINYIILILFANFLVRLTFKYHNLYTKSSLAATILTNVVLYGISDSLAQSIPAFLDQRQRIMDRSRSSNRGSGSRNRSTSVSSVSSASSISSVQEVSNYIRSIQSDDLFVDYGDTSMNSDAAFASPEFSTVIAFKYKFNFRRFVAFIFWGFIMAFIQVAWYSFLNSMYKDMPKFVNVLERVLTDQLCFSPISLICFYTYGTIVIDNGTMDDVKDKLYRLYIPTLAFNFCLWFPVQFFNFSVMPPKFQVPLSSAVGVLWNCFLSMKNASG